MFWSSVVLLLIVNNYSHYRKRPQSQHSSTWKCLCSSFSSLSMDLCNVLAALARKLDSSYVDPVSLSHLMASRLIALDKNPGVHPIAIGEVCRRILGKAILRVIKPDILEARQLAVSSYVLARTQIVRWLCIVFGILVYG